MIRTPPRHFVCSVKEIEIKQGNQEHKNGKDREDESIRKIG
jgi:hypothetical protein